MRMEDSLRENSNTRFLVAGRLVLDRADQRAWLDSRPLELGNKALATLEELMRNPQLLVSKDRLFDVAWPDQAVSDAVLTTAIRELRRALSDPARNPDWIETEHGKGYRFLPLVEARSVHPGRQEVAPPSNEAQAASKSARPAAGRWLWLALPLLLALAALIAWQAPFEEGPNAAEENPTAHRIAVLPFTVQGEEQWIGSAMSARVTDVLSNAPGVFVVESDVAASISEADDRAAVAELNQVGSVVEGVLQVADGTVAVNIRIASAAGEDVWRRQLTGSQEDIITLTERVALETARVMAIAADPENLEQMADIGTRSVAAFEAYTRASAILDSIEGYRGPDRIERAIEYLEDAVVADPHFAKAAASLSWFISAGSYTPDAQVAEARSLALLQIATENAANNWDRRSYHSTIDMRMLRFASAKRELMALYEETRKTSSNLNHSILTMLGNIAAATRDKDLAEFAWREITEYNVARGRVQMKRPHMVAHLPEELERFAQLHAQQQFTPTGAFLRHEALLLLGRTDEAGRLLTDQRERIGGRLATVMAVAQACAERRMTDARNLAQEELNNTTEPSYYAWQLAQIAGMRNTARTLQPSVSSSASQRAVFPLMQDPGFDTAPYPLIVAALDHVGVQELRVPRPAYYCSED